MSKAAPHNFESNLGLQTCTSFSKAPSRKLQTNAAAGGPLPFPKPKAPALSLSHKIVVPPLLADAKPAGLSFPSPKKRPLSLECRAGPMSRCEQPQHEPKLLPAKGRSPFATVMPDFTPSTDLRLYHVRLIREYLTRYQDASQLAKQLKSSAYPDEHLHNMLHVYSDQTIHRYLKTWKRFVEFCDACRWSPPDVPVPQFADCLRELCNRTKAVKAPYVNFLRGVSWAAKFFGFPKLLETLKSELIRSYLFSSVKIGISESITPAPVFLASVLETVVHDPQTPAALCILAGAFLLMFYAGLRFSDIQRCKLCSLHEEHGMLRGKAWKSKNSKQGFAFAAITCGLRGSHTVNWASKFLTKLRAFWETWSSDTGQVYDPTFLVPDIRGPAFFMFARPMHLVRATNLLRYFVSQAQMATPTQAITVHGLKSGLIAIANQLALDPSWIAQQGHHKPQGSTFRYSRDDTWLQVHLQIAIMARLQTGWKPSTPLLRGAGPPIPSEHFGMRLEPLSWSFLIPDSPCPPVNFDDQPDSDSDSSSSESSSSSSDDDMFLLNSFSRTAHRAKFDANHKAIPACGALLSLPGRYYQQSEDIPEGYQLCANKACRCE